MKRVVVTGMGMLTPLGKGVAHNWARIIKGDSGIVAIKSFDTTDFDSKIGGMVPTVGIDNGAVCDVTHLFNPDDVLPPKTQRKISQFIVYAMATTDEAVADAGWKAETDEQKCRTGVVIGSGLGGFDEITRGTRALAASSPRRLSPFFLTNSLVNMASGQISIRHGFKGPNHAITSAFATGVHTLISAAKMIMLDDADVVIAGASEIAMVPLALAGFSAAGVLSTGFNDRPTEASRPWDRDRDGFVMGEGAATLVLEELEHAKKRGAKIYAEVTGYGMSADAYHVTAFPEDGNGGYRSMQMALKKSGLTAADIGYLNAHGTSTLLGDVAEIRAVKRLFGGDVDQLSMSSTKSATGHLLGTAGVVEAIYSIKALETGILPPTLNLENISEDCKGIDLIPKVAKEKKIKAALSNSFGFGGTNASLLFQELS